MEAVVEINGKQYRVSEGQQLTVDRLTAAEGEEVVFERVLLLSDSGQPTVGTPTVEGATVATRVLGSPRGKKVTVYKYKAKKRYRRTSGSRAALSLLEVTSISTRAGKKAGKARASSKTAEPAQVVAEDQAKEGEDGA